MSHQSVDATNTRAPFPNQQPYENSLLGLGALNGFHETGSKGVTTTRLSRTQLASFEGTQNTSQNQPLMQQRPTNSGLLQPTVETDHISSLLSTQLNGTSQVAQNTKVSRSDRMGITFEAESPWRSQDTKHRMETPSSTNARHNEEKFQDDGHSAASTATATTVSPLVAPLNGHVDDERRLPSTAGGIAGTPSTISTVHSVEEHSVDGQEYDLERLSLRIDETPPHRNFSDEGTRGFMNTQTGRSHLPPLGTNRYARDGGAQHQQHRRVPSWESHQSHSSPFNGQGAHKTRQTWGKMSPSGSPSHGPIHHSRIHQRDAWTGNNRSQVRVATFRRSDVPPKTTEAWGAHRQMIHQPVNATNLSTNFDSNGMHHDRHRRSTDSTPPRTRPRPHQKSHGSPSLTGSVGPSSTSHHSRSSSEVLKTLLRKKACLYELGTSKAVALVTWLVGRQLAISHGYFSRQQLQSGVHACVADKIDSGKITRTKVNRCMQIILNSCFHYIIPRPDGCEENSDVFKLNFERTSRDDTKMLDSLPAPWDGLKMDKAAVLEAVSACDATDDKRRTPPVSPEASPHMGSIPVHDHHNDPSPKRAVLLCFNENVRSAADVFLSHNEFIRDTANSAKLQLSSQDWAIFFGKEVPRGKQAGGDVLGRMSPPELNKFRTSWCCKRYDHDHRLCGFAHAEINDGWLRRDPAKHHYSPDLCQYVTHVETKEGRFLINACPHGSKCTKSHSKEEIQYHPQSYKKLQCNAKGVCPLGDICPDFHSPSQHWHKKGHENRSAYRRHIDARPSHHTGNTSHHTGVNDKGVVPMKPTMYYVHPAPMSSFEQHLVLPGLQHLFRRNSAAVKTRTEGRMPIAYDAFDPAFSIPPADHV